MRRVLAIAAAAAALIAPALAHAAKSYTGKVKGDPKTSVELKVSGSGDNRAVRSFVVKRLFIKCEGGQEARLKSASITGNAPVSDEGRFAIKGSSDGQEVALKGKLRGKRRSSGTFRYTGPTTVDKQTLDCRSGRVAWRASR